MRQKPETLAKRLALIDSGREPITCGLDGCPAGGWAVTLQARSRLADALPPRSERSYTLTELVDACYVLDHADRYRWGRA